MTLFSNFESGGKGGKADPEELQQLILFPSSSSPL